MTRPHQLLSKVPYDLRKSGPGPQRPEVPEAHQSSFVLVLEVQTGAAPAAENGQAGDALQLGHPAEALLEPLVGNPAR